MPILWFIKTTLMLDNFFKDLENVRKPITLIIMSVTGKRYKLEAAKEELRS